MHLSILGNPTDTDLERYPAVHLTGPHEWDPSVLDYTHPSGDGEPPWSNDPNEKSAFDSNFDEFGDYTQRVIQFPPEMDENWVRYGLAKLGQISKLPNWQRMLFCAYTTQLLHSTGEVCWNNNDSYFIWFEFVCRNSGQIASRRSWERSCLGLEYTSKCSRLALLWEPN